MREFVVLSPSAALRHGQCTERAAVDLEGVRVHFGLLARPAPRFDASAEHRAHKVLLRVRAFSLNYRDRGGVFACAVEGRDERVRRIGSDYVGEVVAVGSAVHDLRPGMRVIPDGDYAQRASDIVRLERGGLESDQISAEFIVADARRLVAIPESMSDEVAACATIGMITSFSMVRRVDPQPKERVLVLGGRSATSLLLIEALRRRDVEIIAVTRRRDGAEALRRRGAIEVISLDESSTSDWSLHPSLTRLTKHVDCIFDPFADLHMRGAVALLGLGGRYITCGFARQYQNLLGDSSVPAAADLRSVLPDIIFQNLTILGNCLGKRSDLVAAIQAHCSGGFDVPIDSVYSGDRIGDFVHRSFGSIDRIGKVPYVFT